MNTELVEFGDSEGIRRAAAMVADGYALGIYMDGVDALWVDGRRQEAAAKIQAIKGEKRLGKPLSGILRTEVLVPMLDQDQIPESLWPVFLHAQELSARLGALGALRLPIHSEAAHDLPPYMYSQTDDGTNWFQNFIPNGHPTSSQLVNELNLAGVSLPAATSMNVSGQPEIANQDEALAFSRQHDIPLLLHDPHPNPYVRGSFPILGVGPGGLVLLREGHFPGQLFTYILEDDDLDMSQAKPAKFPISPLIIERFAATDLRGKALRQALLEVVHGSQTI